MMKLAVITTDGYVIDVVLDIEKYDLSRPVAKADLLQAIENAVAEAKAQSGK